MQPRKPATVLLTVVAYVVCTFGVQGMSHFVINVDHFAAMTIMRAEPVIPMGILSMLIQGTLFALLFPVFNRDGRALRNGVVFSLALGAFLASYIGLAEAGKYAIPSIPSWIAVELSTAAVQFSAFGVLLGRIHRQPAAAPASAPV
jgi:hypothetical protein